METELACCVCGKSDDYAFFLKNEDSSGYIALRLCEYHFEALCTQISELEK